jgi:hypothetical protein
MEYPRRDLGVRMTDFADLTVEQRLAILEARLGIGVNPLALVPPITVGELTDVPAPGSQIAAQWAQEVSGRIIHRFPTKAAVDAWAAPNGSRAFQTDTSIEWRRVNGVWSQVTPWAYATVGITVNGINPIGVTLVNSLNIPADPGPRVAFISCYLRLDNYYAYVTPVNLVADGNLLGQALTSKVQPDSTRLFPTYNIFLGGILNLRPNVVTTVLVQVDNQSGTAASIFQTVGQPYANRIDATVFPR